MRLVLYMRRSAEILIERRAYESVDEKNLS